MEQRSPSVPQKRTAAFWWLLYVFVGVFVAGVCVYAGFHSRQPWPTRYDSWAQAGILTVGVFGYLLKWSWKYKANVKFWILYASLLAVHCGICVAAFGGGVRFSIFLLGIAGSVEVMATATLVLLVVGRASPHHNWR